MAMIPRSTTIFNKSLSPTTSVEVKIDNENANGILSSQHRDDKVGSMLDSVKSKLVKDRDISIERNNKTGEPEYKINQQTFQNTIDDTISSIREAKTLMDALPDLGMVKDIVISSVLSPNDMISTELTYTVNSELFGDVENNLVKVIKDYFDDEYELPEKLTGWLEKSLFIEGATPLGVIPETAIDHVINSNLKVSKEDFSKVFKDANIGTPVVYGLLGNPKWNSNTPNKRSGISFESFSASANVLNYKPSIEGLSVKVIDNPNILKAPKLIDKVRQDRVKEAYASNDFGLENYRTNNFTTKDTDIYPTRETNHEPVIHMKQLKDLEKKNIGHPVVYNFPVESVIPVYSPSDPSNHVCYFIALDEYGNPLKAGIEDDQTTQLKQRLSNSQNATSQATSSLISTAKKMGLGVAEDYNKEDMDAMGLLYGQVIEKDLIERMEAGGFSAKDLKFSEATELYKLMFTRALKQMETQLLFLPRDYITYMAFDYKLNGIGRSLLDKTKVIGSLRMMNMVAAGIADAKSAIDHRELEIRLDPDDPDPMKRTEQFIHEFQRATTAQFPMGVNNYADIVDYLQKAGLKVKITGHEGMPDMGMDFSNQSYTYNKPDPDYADQLAKKQTMGLGAPPESVNSIEDIEFATQIISKNAFFAKISMWRQRIAEQHISDHIQKYTLNSQPLMTALTEVIEKNRDKLTKIDSKFKSEAIAMVFARNIKVELPEPDLAQIKMQSEAFEEYKTFLENVIPHFVSNEIINSNMAGDKVSEVVDAVVAVLTSYFCRKWLYKNNVLPELFDITNITGTAEESFGFLVEHNNYLDALSPHLREFIIKCLKRAGYSDGVIEKAEELTGEETDDMGGDADYGSSDDSGGEDEGGDDEFGEDDDFEDFDEGGDEEGEDDGDDFDF